MNTGNPLLVPVILEALAVGAGSAPGADVTPDYSLLRDYPFGRNCTNGFFTDSANRPGVHLHWTLPDALLHGTLKADKLYFPCVPNRWIIQRLGACGDRISRKAWIIESDFITDTPGAEPGLMKRTSIPTFALEDGCWRGKVKKDRPYGYLGDRREYGAGPAAEGYYMEKLTAVGPEDIPYAADPLFAACYPRCKTVFGFYDSLQDAEDGSYTYVLAGFYSDRTKDPLYGATGETLAQLQWKCTNGGDPPQSIVCHGQVTSVAWHGPDYAYKSGVPEDDIDVYVANTSIEALSALLQDKMPAVQNFERVLNAVQYNCLHDLEDPANPDALLEFETLLHEKQFSSEDGGHVWNLHGSGANDAGIIIDEAVYRSIGLLQREQSDYEKNSAIMKALQNELYFAWTKYVLSDIELDEETAAAFLKLIGELLKRLSAAREEQDRRADRINTLQNGVNGGLRPTPVRAAVDKGDRFYTPNPPVLLLYGSGVQRAFKQGYQADEDGFLPCRVNPVRELAVTVQGRLVQVGAAEIGNLCDGTLEPLPGELLPYCGEAALVSPDCARAIAVTAYKIAGVTYTEAQLQETMAAIRKSQQEMKGFTGTPPPPLAFGPWKQPWSPLTIEWRINLQPARSNVKGDDSFKPFVLKEIDLEWDENEARRVSGAGQQVQIQGSTLITPHAAENMRECINRLIADFGAAAVDYDALKKAAGLVGKMDVLSQRLDGFNEALIMRDNLPYVPVFYPDADDAILREVTAQLGGSYPSPRIEETETRFLPVRSGRLSIDALRIIDSFGQVKRVNISQDTVHIAENLRSGSPEDAGIILRPRFIQPCTARCRWLSHRHEGNDYGGLEAVDAGSSPVFGFISPNFPDQNVQIYDGAGSLLGFIQRTASGAKWMPPLGLATGVDDIGSPHLRYYVQSLLGEPSAALAELLVYLDRLMNDITAAAPGRFMQLCFGRVIALARMSIDIYGKGLPPHVQWWETAFSCNGYDTERFSVRLGDRRKLDDGLAGFFLGDANPGTYSRFYGFPEQGTSGGGYVMADNTFTTSLAGECVNLTVLLDPLASITVTTGFLPALNIRLKPEFYTRQLEEMKIYFRLAPALNQPEGFELPLPGGMRDSWRFQYICTKAGQDEVRTVDKIAGINDLLPARRPSIYEGFLTSERKE